MNGPLVYSSMVGNALKSELGPLSGSPGVKLDDGSMLISPGALSWREIRILRAYFSLPADVRNVLFFGSWPWCLPLQTVLNRMLGGVHEIDVLFKSGPLAGSSFRTRTSEKYFLLGTAYERHNWEMLVQLAQPGDVVYDVGAHAGYWALGLARIVGGRGQVVAFEPSTNNFARLFQNVSLNRSACDSANIIPLNIAAGDREGSTTLTEAGTMSRLRDYGQAFDNAVVAEVSVRRLDDLIFVDRYPLPSMLFIDVEGSAGGVLRGAQRLLHERRPAVFCEVHSPQENREIDAALAPHGYALKEQVGRGKRLPLHFLFKPTNH